MSGPQRGNGRGRFGWNPYARSSNTGRRPKPISVAINNVDDDETSESQSVAVRHIAAKNEECPGWNLYFPGESEFNNSKGNSTYSFASNP